MRRDTRCRWGRRFDPCTGLWVKLDQGQQADRPSKLDREYGARRRPITQAETLRQAQVGSLSGGSCVLPDSRRFRCPDERWLPGWRRGRHSVRLPVLHGTFAVSVLLDDDDVNVNLDNDVNLDLDDDDHHDNYDHYDNDPQAPQAPEAEVPRAEGRREDVLEREEGDS
jgi:hypothetical protein